MCTKEWMSTISDDRMRRQWLSMEDEATHSVHQLYLSEKILHGHSRFLQNVVRKGESANVGHLVLFLPVCHLHDDLDAFISERDFRTQANIADGPEENRICRVPVFERLDARLYEVKDEKVFQKCFREIFEAHYWVYEKAKIIHRDISIFNLMVRKGSDGTMIGVLNDWDLAEDQNKASESSESRTGTRTGTRPFMCLEVNDLELPPAHILRFDLESFLYFLIWSVFVIPNEDVKKEAEKEAEAKAEAGKWIRENKGAMLKGWWTKYDDSLLAEKVYTLNPFGKKDFLRSPYRFSTTVEKWISPIWDLFINGYWAKAATTSEMQGAEEETLGNHVTYQKIHDILQKMPE